MAGWLDIGRMEPPAGPPSQPKNPAKTRSTHLLLEPLRLSLKLPGEPVRDQVDRGRVDPKLCRDAHHGAILADIEVEHLKMPRLHLSFEAVDGRRHDEPLPLEVPFVLLRLWRGDSLDRSSSVRGFRPAVG